MKKILIVVLSLFALTAIFTACKKENPKPQPTPTKYTVSFYSDDELIKSIETAGNEKITLPTVSEKPGYTFGGWYTDKDVWTISFTEDSYLNTPLTQDLSVYAKWTKDAPATYTLTFISDGKTYTTIQKTDGSVLQKAEFPTPDKAGYTFVGWFTDEDFSNAVSYPYIVSKNDTFYAKWTKDAPATYTLTFISDGETYTTLQKTDGSVLQKAEFPTPDKAGYTFVGWFTDEACKNAVSYPYIVSKNDTFYAKWTKDAPATYTLTFISDGKTYTTLQKTDGSVLQEDDFPTPDKAGYTFVGWFTDEACKNAVSYPYIVNKNDTFYAKWTKDAPATYTLTFISDGETYTTLQKTDGSVLQKAEFPTPDKAGYTFIGWFTDEACKNAVSYPYIVSKNDTFYAKCTKDAPATYTITLESDGEVFETLQKENGSVLEEGDIPTPTKSGYTFSGWFTDEAFSNAVPFPYKVNKNDTFYAKWTKDPDPVYSFNISDGTITGITGTLPESGEMIIPEKVNGQTVIAIGSNAFASNKSIKSVNLPSTIKTIGSYAFQSCTKLQSINFPEGLTTIDDSAFSFCMSLDGITFPSTLQSIGDSAFRWCEALTSVTLPDATTRLAAYAFSDCSSLSLVNLNKVESIGMMAFSRCKALTSISLPDTLISMGNATFSYCSKLADISLPENRALSVDYNIVDGTAYANNSENYENGVLYIGKYLIKTSSDFSTVETYTVKAGTICIANHAMYYNTGKLTTLNLPNGVIRIGTESFASSANLSKITLPESLLYVSENAFENTAYLNNYNNNKTNSEADGTLYLGTVLLSAKWFTGTEFSVKAGTITIADGALFEKSKAATITNIILPDSLKSIGNNAFKETGSTSVSLPEGIIRIGDSAFSACKSLSSVSPTPNLEELGQYAFSNCQLTTFVLPSSVWYIGVMPFAKNPIETLYCEAESKPSGWQNSWNQTFNATFNTVWGYKG